MSTPEQAVKNLASQHMSDKELAIRLIELHKEHSPRFPLADFINMYRYIVKSLANDTEVKIEFGRDMSKPTQDPYIKSR
ncbi:hypothetical protein [Sphingobacterium sp. LRF_L2]|uniref:hypothetical protein n=1 Tax=Sphingobacterium sp. LRF_L2 TaxID=3369421 RepID=UPI003F60FA63